MSGPDIFLESYGAILDRPDSEAREKNRAAFEKAIAAAETADATLHWPKHGIVYL